MLLLVSGCYSSPEGFWKSLQKGLCKYNRDCGLDYDFASIGDCAEDRFDKILSPDEFDEMCGEYAREQGYVCLQYLRDKRDSCEELERYPMKCYGVCGPGSQIEFAVEQPAEGAVMTPLLTWDAE